MLRQAVWMKTEEVSRREVSLSLTAAHVSPRPPKPPPDPLIFLHLRGAAHPTAFIENKL